MKWALVFGLALAGGSALLEALAPEARLRVTQRDLVPRCLEGREVTDGRRDWELRPGPVALVFSMRSLARPGLGTTEPGLASITFTAEAGHRYEVEVRAAPMAFSTRAWRAREWIPVVRDRTTDRVVSREPVWLDGPCPGGQARTPPR